MERDVYKRQAKIHVITMGPPAAKAVLQEAFALGADEGWLLTDRKFAGADVLATSYTIASGTVSYTHLSTVMFTLYLRWASAMRKKTR